MATEIGGEFRKELEALINKHDRECGSDTPDFVLAEYLEVCLAAFDVATRKRDDWYGTIDRRVNGDQPSQDTE
jgi:hypothetical protein